jgi:conjugal transfer pilus assembly protein TraW
MTYTLNFDITDAGGNIIYPRGYRFNPLEHINYNKTLVIINATVPKQIEWLASSPYAKDINTMVLITDGSYYDMMKRLKRPVYYANAALLERFRVVAVPAVVRQNGNTMQVREIPPERTSNAKKVNRTIAIAIIAVVLSANSALAICQSTLFNR